MKLFTFTLVSLVVGLAAGGPGPANEANQQGIETRQSYIGQSCVNTKAGNLRGTCQWTSTCVARTGTTDSNPDCPGPDGVQCCIFDDCVNGAAGTCLDTRDWNCQGGGGWNR